MIIIIIMIIMIIDIVQLSLHLHLKLFEAVELPRDAITHPEMFTLNVSSCIAAKKL